MGLAERRFQRLVFILVVLNLPAWLPKFKLFYLSSQKYFTAV
jgi:hypothetical protein